MPPPAVSVVIPVYNVEKYLQKCLDSVLAQTLKDIEIVCVNDGSTDDSRNILAEYVKKDNRIKVIDQLNQGQSVARNTGTAVATGKYIYFLDSDDWLEPDAMQSCFEIAEKNQLDEIIFDCITEYENEDLHSAFHFKNKGTIPSGKAMPGEELFSRQVEAQEHMSCVWLRFLNRDFYLRSNLSFEPGIIHEDELFCVCCDVSAKRALFLSKRLYHYRLRKNSTVTAPPTLFRFHSMVTVLEHSCMFVQDHPQ